MRNTFFRATVSGVAEFHDSDTVENLQSWANIYYPKNCSVCIRSNYTSDGSLWTPCNGRIVSVRENGRWIRF